MLGVPMGEEMTTIGARFPRDEIAALDAEVFEWRSVMKPMRVNRSDIIRLSVNLTLSLLRSGIVKRDPRELQGLHSYFELTKLTALTRGA